MRVIHGVLVIFWLLLSVGAEAAEEPTKLLRFPTVSDTQVAFVYANDIWVAPRAGGTAVKLTSHPGREWFPRFSPDGKLIAFTGDYDGNTDVYVIPATGGEPRRLTWSPDISASVPERFGPDNAVMGWTPDGKVIFRSRRDQWNVFMGRPHTVSPKGGLPEALDLPWAGTLSFAPDGKRLAYNPTWREFRTWKRYRGGMAQDIYLYDLASKQRKRITKDAAVDDFPMWVGEQVFFVSERKGRANLWVHDLSSGSKQQLTRFEDFDVKWPSLGPGAIAFERGGRIHLYDFAKKKTQALDIRVPSDRIQLRERVVDGSKNIEEFWLAPDGKRVLFVARGELFTVPAEHGPTRNLSRSPGARERHAMWSPDGSKLAYLTDESGEYEVAIRSQDGKGAAQVLTKGADAFRFQLVWSPDSKKLAFADKNLRLWCLDVETKKLTRLDQAEHWEIRHYTWSPDSRYLAYAKTGANFLDSIWLHDLQKNKSSRITSEWFDDEEPIFDPAGRYLYFLSNRDFNATLSQFESNYVYSRLTRPFAIVLSKNEASPFAPRSDETALSASKAKADEEKKASSDASSKKVKKTRIDLAGIEQRAVAFPVPAGNLWALRASADKVFWLRNPTPTLTGERVETQALKVFDLKERKLELVHQPVANYELAPNGEKLVYHSEATYYLADAKAKQKPGDEKVLALDLSGLRARIEPRAEWRQMFFEAWRLQRDYFYAPNMNAVDWPGLRDRYAALLPHVAHRIDLTYLIGELIGELGTGHAYVGGGDLQTTGQLSIGLLGAELTPDPASGRWRIERIFEGQNWDPNRRSPLTEPGLNVKPGDYLLAVEGRQLRLPDQAGQLLLDRVGKQTLLTISSIPSASGAREVTVVPIERDAGLRYHAWVEENRRRVEKASGGRIGYLHIPDMGGNGLNQFVRTFYPQVEREALIVDVRWNGGGFVSQMIIERLRRKLGGMSASRNAGEFTYPGATHVGPKICLINQWSASDGDLFPHFFRRYGLGKLLGQRTWGGVVGIRGNSNLVDGGYVYQPEFAYYDLDSKWMIENRGVEPDLVVDNPPAAVMSGRDPQLERAIELMLEAIEKKKPELPARPADPSGS